MRDEIVYILNEMSVKRIKLSFYSTKSARKEMGVKKRNHTNIYT